MEGARHSGFGKQDDMIIIYNNLHEIKAPLPGSTALIAKVGAVFALS
jgi:hypothetical protein